MTREAAADRYQPYVGSAVGDLTFLGISPNRGDSSRILGAFRCGCGREVTMPAGRVLHGGSRRHCGCKTDRGANRRHGMRNSTTYSSWQSMKGRCLDPGNKDFPRWGGSGVRIHPAWIETFEAFYTDMGDRPAGTTLDRIDSTGNYEPGNCRWATGVEQASNTKQSWTVEIDGRLFPSAEAAARAHGVSTTTITRWCDGYIDQRRINQENGGRISPMHNCKRWRTYQ